MRLLLVDENTELLRQLMRALRSEGFAVDGATDGESGLFKATSWVYDAVVLDLVLPKLSGWDLLRQLRLSHNTPVLIHTSLDELGQRVEALDTGADDFVVKPCEPQEVAARLRALIRRAAGQSAAQLTVGDVQIDTAARNVTRLGEVVPLTAREFALVEFLALHRGKLVSRTMIYDHLFDEHDDTLSNLVEVHVFNVRQKLGKDFIRTRRGLGYVIDG